MNIEYPDRWIYNFITHIHEIDFDQMCFMCVGATLNIDNLLEFVGATVEI